MSLLLLKSSVSVLSPKLAYCEFFFSKNITSKQFQKKIEECYKILKVPYNSKQEDVRQSFLDLAKKYHPDSGSPEANIDQFVAIEEAFRVLTKHNTGGNSKDDVDKIVYDIIHTAPQHRQYLSFDGVGHGTPYQRQKQYQQVRAQKAATNVMEHRIAKTVAADNTIMKKGQYGQKHAIKTKYGFDRLVEDLIQESMSKGEFENLSGKGKPLKEQNTNPYVDFTTHKLNEVLINNGFTPEWIMLNKEIDQEIEALKKEVRNDRMYLGPYPFNEVDSGKWTKIYESNKELADSINMKINKYNLIVPLMNKQKFYVEFDKISQEIAENGQHSVEKVKAAEPFNNQTVHNNEENDFLGIMFKAFSEVFNNINKKRKKGV